MAIKSLSNISEVNSENPSVTWYKPTAVPPSYYDDAYPSHRLTAGPYFLRLGDCQFLIPPMFITVTNQTGTQQIPVIRQKESMTKKSGYSNREIEMSIWFGNTEQINGMRMDGPDGDVYHMDGLRPLIAQFKRSPFLPIVNELLNEVYGIYAVTLLNVSVNTVKDFPGCLQATLTLKEFNSTPLTGLPNCVFDRMHCWPLYRWYYQQMMSESPTSVARTHLPKIKTKNMTGRMRLRMLPEHILNADIEGFGNQTDQRYTMLSNEYIYMEEVDMGYDDFWVESIQIGLTNIVSNLQLSYHENPTTQYLGSLDTMITVSMQTKSRQVLKNFVELEKLSQSYSRIYKDKITSGYIGIENEIINLFGVETVTLQSMNSSTVEGNPDLFTITLTLLSYNKTQKEQERPNGMGLAEYVDNDIEKSKEYLTITKNKSDYQIPIMIDGLVESMISSLELYPDMELPTYDKVASVIDKINSFRKVRKFNHIGIDGVDLKKPFHDSIFVDPDFYFFYPSPDAFGILDEVKLDEAMGSLRGGSGSGMLDVRLKHSGTGVNSLSGIKDILAQTQIFGEDFGIPITLAQDVDYDMPFVAEDELYKHMFHDMVKYDKRGTMLRAFPTMMFLFVDEGQRVRSTRMWSNYYAYHAVISASITSDKDAPGDVCEIVMSNIYNSLSSQYKYPKIKRSNGLGLIGKAMDWWDTAFMEVDDEMLAARMKLHDYMAIRAGCRIHLRIGYGSSPRGLPVAFNGSIAEINVGDVLTIVGQSDGAELMNPLHDMGAKSKNSVFKLGQEPSTAIRTIMTARDGFQGLFNFRNGDKELSGFSNGSKYGIEHFGYVYSQIGDGPGGGSASNLWKSVMHLEDQGRFSYDVTKNIYKGAPYLGDIRTTDPKNDRGGTEASAYEEAEGKSGLESLKDNIIKDVFGEENANMYLFGKAPWDIFKTFSAGSVDYITATAPHGFRTTLFFGQPHWLYKYGYIYKGGDTLEERMVPENYYELVKSFQQVHILDSINDIIDNGVVASSTGVINCVIPTYTEGETVKSDMVIWADKNILPEFHRTAYYDTTAVQDYLGPEFLYTSVFIRPAKKRARAMGIDYLQNSFREMYKGEILIMGDPSIKPHDICYIMDSYTKTAGPTTAGRVTHSIDVATGFTTSIKPDLITINQQMPGSEGLAHALGAIQLFCYNNHAAKVAMQSSASIAMAKEMFNRESKLEIENKLKNTGIAVGAAAVGYKFAAAALTASIGFPVFIAAFGAWQAVSKSIDWLTEVFSHKDYHTITAIPLYHKDRPLLSGVRGHKTLLPYTAELDNKEDDYEKVDVYTSLDSVDTIIAERRAEEQALNAVGQGKLSSGVDIFRVGRTPEGMVYSSYASGAYNVKSQEGYIWPMPHGQAKTRITSPYGPRWGKFHYGVDFGEPVGMEVLATEDGKVEFGGWQTDKGGYGQYVKLQHKDGNKSVYAHLSKVIAQTGQDIKKGQVIGLVGSTGNSTGPHLHFEIQVNGEQVNPMSFKFQDAGTKKANNQYAVPESNANGSADIPKGVNSESGTIDGKQYISTFKNAVVTSYDDIGLTAGGKYTTDNSGKLCAAHGLPFGTKIYIPSLKSVNGTGIFLIEDTGGPYFDFDINTTVKIGKALRDVYVLSYGQGRDTAASFDEMFSRAVAAGQKPATRNAYTEWKDLFVTKNL